MPLDGNYILTNDIDCSATAGWNGGAGFNPIGDDRFVPANQFSGVFDGQDYKITNLFINRPANECVGLFGLLRTAEIKNLGLENVDITADGYVGSLTGNTRSWSTITDCYATGVVSGFVWYTGGLVGINDGNTPISRSYFSGTVRGFGNIGGLIGYSNFGGGPVSECYSAGSVIATGGDYVGGLIGANDNSIIIDSYSTSNVSGGNNYSGGLVGGNYNNITNCYSVGSVSGISFVGGLVGDNLVAGVCNNSYWDTLSSGQGASACGLGRTTAQMKQQATFTGWDFTNIWAIIENTTYPWHRW